MITVKIHSPDTNKPICRGEMTRWLRTRAVCAYRIIDIAVEDFEGSTLYAKVDLDDFRVEHLSGG